MSLKFKSAPAALASLLLASGLLAACASPGPVAPAEVPIAAGPEQAGSLEDRVAFFVHHARNGELDGVREALAAGVPINARDSLDQTALIAAVSHNSLEVVQLLLQRGADPELVDRAGWSPLHYATYFGSGSEILATLLDHGAEIDARNDRGITALYFASATGHEVQVRLLLARGADPLIASQSGYTPLRVAKVRGLDGIVALLDAAKPGASARP